MGRCCGIGDVYTYDYKLRNPKTRNVGFGYYDPEIIKTRPDPNGTVLVDGVLSVLEEGKPKPEPKPEPKMEEIVVGNQIWMKNSYNIDNMGITKNGITYYNYPEISKIYNQKIYPENFVMPTKNDVLILRKYLIEHPEQCSYFAQQYTGEIHPNLKDWNKRLVLWYNRCDYLPPHHDTVRTVLHSIFDLDLKGNKNIYSTLATYKHSIPIRLIKKVA